MNFQSYVLFQKSKYLFFKIYGNIGDENNHLTRELRLGEENSND